MIKKLSKTVGMMMLIIFTTSITPVMADDAQVKELDVQDGSITNVVAFKDGKYIYEGYRGDNESGVFYNDGTSEKKLDGVDSLDYSNDFSGNAKFGDKYALVKDGTNQYMVDLSTGEMSDENKDDLKDTVENKLRSKLRRTERYNQIAQLELSKVDNGMLSDNGVWYQYKATTGASADVTYYGYVDDKGNYIDCSKIANMEVYDGNRMVKVDEYDKEVDKYNKDKPIKVKLNGLAPLGQDANYIYAVANVSITNGTRFNNDNPFLPKVFLDRDKTSYFVQKISKATGEKEDGAFLPKEVDSYWTEDMGKNVEKSEKYMGARMFLSSYYASFKAGNTTPFLVRISSSGRIMLGYLNTEVTTLNNSEHNPEATILYTKLANPKLKRDSDGKFVEVKSATIMGNYYTEAEDFSMDNDGTIWSVWKGKISKYFAWIGFKEVYKCDSSINHIDSYNGNIVAWSDTTNSFVTAKQNIPAVATTTSSAVTVSNQTGWQKAQDGWHFYDVKGNAAKQWIKYGENWYYLDDKGIMKTGWVKAENGKWYYLNASGAMEANTTIDGYLLGTDGAWIQ